MCVGGKRNERRATVEIIGQGAEYVPAHRLGIMSIDLHLIVLRGSH